MAYEAKIIEIIIASPGDVAEERRIVRDVIAGWNAIHARDCSVVLLPVSWETHSSPDLSGRPQQIINDRLLAHVDLLVGIFWTRVGSPTGKAISGSIEEIQEHRRQGKPVMLYFSNLPVVLDSVDQAQYQHLKTFKNWAMGEGLVEFFESRDDFREKFSRHLPITLRDNPYLKSILAQRADISLEHAELVTSGHSPLSADARELLTAAATDQQGTVMILRGLNGTVIQAGEQTFGDSQNRRSIAHWEAAIMELRDHDLVNDVKVTDDGVSIFQVNNAGYRLVENAT